LKELLEIVHWTNGRSWLLVDGSGYLWRESDNDNRKGIGKGDYVAYFEGWERRERGNEGQEIGEGRGGEGEACPTNKNRFPRPCKYVT